MLRKALERCNSPIPHGPPARAPTALQGMPSMHLRQAQPSPTNPGPYTSVALGTHHGGASNGERLVQPRCTHLQRTSNAGGQDNSSMSKPHRGILQAHRLVNSDNSTEREPLPWAGHGPIGVAWLVPIAPPPPPPPPQPPSPRGGLSPPPTATATVAATVAAASLPPRRPAALPPSRRRRRRCSSASP